MEFNEISVEHSSNQNGGPNQHYQQHFQQHYAATSSDRLATTPLGTPMMTTRFPHVPGHQTTTISSVHGPNFESRKQEVSTQHQSPLSSYESHSQVVHTNSIDPCTGNLSQIQEKHEKQQSKKTVQTTTTTTTTQPVIVAGPVCEGDQITAVEHTQLVDGGNRDDFLERSYTITVEHHNAANGFNWSNLDTYLHIFLTFFFGYFTAMLFFDGILRSIVYLYILEHTLASPLIYIINIIFSIAMIAFTIWFLTICWRWWRNKSLFPTNTAIYHDQFQRQMSPRQRHSNAHGYVFLAGCILIIGFLIFLTIGIIDISFKRDQEIYNKAFKRYSKAIFMGDLLVFCFHLVLWIIGIIATFLLSRDVLLKYCCPSKHIKINKEKPTTIYEVRN